MRPHNDRAPFQVLVLPYRVCHKKLHYAILRRRAQTGGYWQFIAGGGHDGENCIQAARREAIEEAGISSRARLVRLDAVAMLPVEQVDGFRWGPYVLVIPEFCFGVQIVDAEIRLSREHTEFRWMSYQSAMRHLYWDSNRTALWELDLRLRRELDGAAVASRRPRRRLVPLRKRVTDR